MANPQLDSNSMVAGRDVNTDIAYAARDVVKNYISVSQLPNDIGGQDLRRSERMFSQAPIMLLRAAKDANLECAEEALEYIVDINHTDSNDRSALHFAAASGCSEIAQLLLSRRGISVNARDNLGQTALMIATLEGNVEVVRLILNHNRINLNVRNNATGRTALIYATECGHRDIVQLVAEHPSTTLDIKDNSGDTAIAIATRNNRWDIIKVIDHSRRPLLKASSTGDIKTLQHLLSQPGTEINVKDTAGRTPLWYASESGYVDVVRVILNHPGVDVNVQDIWGETPLMWASMYGHTDVVNLLVDHRDIFINTGDHWFKIALQRATSNNHWNTAKALELATSPMALLKASSAGDTKTVQNLLSQQGTDINLRDTARRTALWYACNAGHVGVVRLLLGQSGVDLNVKDLWGETALMWASKNGHKEVVIMLLDDTRINLGADGRAALQWAGWGGQTDIANLLRTKGGIV